MPWDKQHRHLAEEVILAARVIPYASLSLESPVEDDRQVHSGT
ncbi:hypothetical protein T08_11243 [Trichinella sp. T8]|uniref:Uncharacterized protein n=1 Tax=Trichinella murrelli TaxID=144512 RepID=A0A0V0T4D6_9BILA|nr:hypothetical protein T05_1524 [Trichinella murrelli]KRZ90590.1 hypothetical protein T08_11243 [Trichinella sp. T8]